MAKRKRHNRRGGSERLPVLVSRLPFPMPLSKEEFGRQNLTAVVDNPEIADHYERCFQQIIASGRCEAYVRMIAMLAHSGRLQEFDERSYGKFLEESLGQRFTVVQLERALDLILEFAGPRGDVPNPAARWELLAFTADFVRSYAEHLGIGDKLTRPIENVESMAILTYVLAVKADLGLAI